MQIEQMTNRQIEIEQVRRRINAANSEIDRIVHEVLPGMFIKQARRKHELERQENLAEQEAAKQPKCA